jgi:hypothetical protein
VTALAARTPFRTTAVVAAVSAGLLLGGCSFTSRDLTLEPYAPSDGLQADLGDVLVRNVLVVSEGDGAPGLVSATIANRGDDDASVLLEVAGASEELDVPANGTLVIGVEGGTSGSSQDGPETVSVVVDSVEPLAGGTLEVTVTDPASSSAVLEVPVVRPAGPYAELTPPSS